MCNTSDDVYLVYICCHCGALSSKGLLRLMMCRDVSICVFFTADRFPASSKYARFIHGYCQL